MTNSIKTLKNGPHLKKKKEEDRGRELAEIPALLSLGWL